MHDVKLLNSSYLQSHTPKKIGYKGPEVSIFNRLSNHLEYIEDVILLYCSIKPTKHIILPFREC